jgi:ElaB/YqjD/DUF883 family membrane-anchored ribosome-binding protein
MATTAADAQSTASQPKSDIDQLRDDVAALREDFSSLAATTGRLAAGALRTQSKRARVLADTAAKEAGIYRDVVSDKVREHPFASVGAAILVGVVVSSLRRR